MKILLAEDDFVTRKFMRNFLSKYGECDVTVDGMEAVDAFMMAMEDDEPYDPVCLDVMMPVMDGYLKSEEIVGFVFEAFDELWKDPSSPAASECNWGIYDINRKKKW